MTPSGMPMSWASRRKLPPSGLGTIHAANDAIVDRTHAVRTVRLSNRQARKPITTSEPRK